MGIQTELSNAHAVKHKEIIKSNKKQGKDVKKVRSDLAVKEHIWRINKKWVIDEEEVIEKTFDKSESSPEVSQH